MVFGGNPVLTTFASVSEHWLPDRLIKFSLKNFRVGCPGTLDVDNSPRLNPFIRLNILASSLDVMVNRLRRISWCNF